MKGSIKLFTLFGIDIKLHFSWWFVFILLAWMLSVSFFPAFCSGEFTAQVSECSGVKTATYWLMGIVASLLLFVSVLMHELSHSLVAKARKIRVESITLFFFGGVAGIDKDDIKPSSEFLMAIAGPLFSLFLSGMFFFVYKFNGNFFWTAITFYLYQLNFILAVFNMIPGFPLDGGRALRAVLYWRYKDLKKATYVAAKGGKFFAIIMILLGVFGLFTGLGGGLWFIFLGGFLYFIAGASYEQVVIREVLQEVPVKDIMKSRLPVLNPKLKFAEIIKKYSNTEDNFFLVKDNKFVGLLDIKSMAPLPLKTQQATTVKQLAVPVDRLKSVKMSDTAYTAFKKLAQEKTEILSVQDSGSLKGFVTQSVLMHRLVWGLKYGLQKKVKKVNK